MKPKEKFFVECKIKCVKDNSRVEFRNVFLLRNWEFIRYTEENLWNQIEFLHFKGYFPHILYTVITSKMSDCVHLFTAYNDPRTREWMENVEIVLNASNFVHEKRILWMAKEFKGRNFGCFVICIFYCNRFVQRSPSENKKNV